VLHVCAGSKLLMHGLSNTNVPIAVAPMVLLASAEVAMQMVQLVCTTV